MNKQKQQVRRQKPRGSEKFEFSSQNIGKRTGKLIKVHDKDNNYLRWSDTTQLEDEYIVAKQQSSSSFSIIQRQNELNDTRSQKSKSSRRSKSLLKHQVSHKLRLNKLDDDQQEDIEKKPAIIDLKRQNQVEKEEQVIQNKIKPNLKEQKPFTLERSSQQVNKITNLQQSSSNQELYKQNLVKKGKSVEQQQRKSKQQQKRLQMKQNNHKKKEESNKQAKPNLKYSKQSIEVEQSQKQRGFLKNDKKAKTKPDHGSIQFEYVLPQQLRNLSNQEPQSLAKNKQQMIENAIKRGRPQQSEEDSNQQHKSKRKTNRSKLQKQSTHKTLVQQNRKFQNRKQASSTSDQEKLSLQISNGSKQRQIYHHKDDLAKKQSFPVKSKKVGKNKEASQNLSFLENSRLKKRKIDGEQDQQFTIVEQVIQVSSNSQASRPQRTRSRPLKFYENQRLAYNSRNEIVFSGISNQKFIEVLGFESALEIGGNLVQYSSNSYKHRINLKKNQTIYSYGVNEGKLLQNLKSLADFDKIWISYYLHPVKEVTVKIDNSPAKTLVEQIQFQRGQKVQIRNSSNRRTISIIVTIQRRPKGKK